MITIKCNKRNAVASELETLTEGSVGIKVRYQFGAEWAGLTKVPVFCCGDVLEPDEERIGTITDGQCVIPHEVLIEGLPVWAGVYGTNGSTIVIPTIWCQLGLCKPGANGDADPSADPTLPVWVQIESMIGDLDDLDTENNSSLVEAINEVNETAENAMTQAEADARYLKLSGGTMTGDLNMSGTRINFGASSIRETNTSTITLEGDYSGDPVILEGVGTPEGDTDAANKGYVDDAVADALEDYTKTSDLADVATSGSYDDLNDTPTIPTVNNATLTIKQGGVTKGTFSANASEDAVVDLDAGSGASMPVTTNLIKGDGAGGASAATPGTDYIKPDANGDVEIEGDLYLKKDRGVMFYSTYYNNAPELTLYGSEGDESVRLRNIAAPSLNSDAANKGYVDSAIDAIPLDDYATETWVNGKTDFYKLNSSIEDGGLGYAEGDSGTITWDGDTDGKPTITFTPDVFGEDWIYCKVSDVVIPTYGFIGAELTVYHPTTTPMEITVPEELTYTITDTDGHTAAVVGIPITAEEATAPYAISATHAGEYDIGGVYTAAIPEPGTYFFILDKGTLAERYINPLVYDYSTIHKIDEQFIPELSGYATEGYVDDAIAAAIGDAIGGAY